MSISNEDKSTLDTAVADPSIKPEVITFTSPKPDVRIKVFDREYHLSAAVLGHHSPLFAFNHLDRLDRENKGLASAEFVYEFVATYGEWTETFEKNQFIMQKRIQAQKTSAIHTIKTRYLLPFEPYTNNHIILFGKENQDVVSHLS